MYFQSQHYLNENDKLCALVYSFSEKNAPLHNIVGGQHGHSGRINLPLLVMKSQIYTVTTHFS